MWLEAYFWCWCHGIVVIDFIFLDSPSRANIWERTSKNSPLCLCGNTLPPFLRLLQNYRNCDFWRSSEAIVSKRLALCVANGRDVFGLLILHCNQMSGAKTRRMHHLVDAMEFVHHGLPHCFWCWQEWEPKFGQQFPSYLDISAPRGGVKPSDSNWKAAPKIWDLTTWWSEALGDKALWIVRGARG